MRQDVHKAVSGVIFSGRFQRRTTRNTHRPKEDHTGQVSISTQLGCLSWSCVCLALPGPAVQLRSPCFVNDFPSRVAPPWLGLAS